MKILVTLISLLITGCSVSPVELRSNGYHDTIVTTDHNYEDTFRTIKRGAEECWVGNWAGYGNLETTLYSESKEADLRMWGGEHSTLGLVEIKDINGSTKVDVYYGFKHQPFAKDIQRWLNGGKGCK